MKKQRNFKLSEFIMDKLRELATSNGMSNTATLELLIIEAHTEKSNMFKITVENKETGFTSESSTTTTPEELEKWNNKNGNGAIRKRSMNDLIIETYDECVYYHDYYQEPIS